jgi:membrane protein implicated in regulation of membrane protease activity
LFAFAFVNLAYWADRIPSGEVGATQARAHNWLASFNWAFVAFLLLQFVFAFAAIRVIVRNEARPSQKKLQQNIKTVLSRQTGFAARNRNRQSGIGYS